MSYKLAKAQSQFIEIMRELSRFRDEFNDTYSMRSKLLKAKEVTTSINKVIGIKEKSLSSAQDTLNRFQTMAGKLFEVQSPSTLVSK